VPKEVLTTSNGDYFVSLVAENPGKGVEQGFVVVGD
jgi:hypothetical protein